MAWWRKDRASATAERAVMSSCDLGRVAAHMLDGRRKRESADRASLIEACHHLREVFLRFCRLATVDEYIVWLKEFAKTHGPDSFTFTERPLGLVEGDSPATHFEDLTKWDLAKGYFVQGLAGLYVLESLPLEVPDRPYLTIMVPAGLVLPSSMTQNLHGCQLCFVDGYRVNHGKVLIFKDVAERLAAD